MFYNLEKQWRDDKDLVLIAVAKDGLDLSYVSDEFKNNNKVVLTAINQNINALQFSSEEIKNDIELLRILNDNKNNVSKENKKWLIDKMNTLSIKEKEMWMNENIPVNKKITKSKKF